ncbi:toxin TcdB middle/N-terminal domain-containing protein, partial [Candidatus Omnitrophota bacterium]
MKRRINRIISVFLIICHFSIVGFQDAAYAKSDNVPASEAKAPKEKPGKPSDGGGDEPVDDPATEALAATASALTIGVSGAGSLSEGLMSNFRHDPFSGSAVLSLPIAVPAGRKGIQPNVGLSYSPTGGNGFLGAGWQMSMGRIERSTKRGVPAYDSSDTFIFSLGGSNQELVEIAPGEYRAKIESSFSKFIFNGTYWLVTDKKGTKYYLGQTSSTQQQKSASEVYSWYLDKVVDLHGNSLALAYQFDQGQIYPGTIAYTTNDLQGDSAKYAVNFTLEDRPTQAINYRSGIKITTAKRLKAIEVKYNQDLSRKYVLNYQESTSASRSILTSITQYGSDGTTALPPLEFTYSEKPPEVDDLTSWNNIRGAGGGSNHRYVRYVDLSNRTRVDIFDINGDGLADRVMQDAADRYWEVQLNNGTSFENTIDWGYLRAAGGGTNYYFIRYTASGRTRVDIFDINGDGLPDRVMQDAANGWWEVQLNNGVGFEKDIDWGPINTGGGTSDYYYIRYIKNNRTRVDIFDINGDGLPDRVMQDASGNKWEVQLNTGTGFGAVIQWDNIDSLGVGGDYWFIRFTSISGRTRVDIFDINGDGLPDRVMQDTANSTWEVQLNTGTGFADTIQWVTIDDLNLEGYCFMRYTNTIGRTKVDIFDINGDGLPDRVMQDKASNKWEIQLNTGSGFAEVIKWTGIECPIDDGDYWYMRNRQGSLTTADIFDIDGNGLPDRAMQDGANDTWEVQKNTGYLPDLILSAANGIGGTIDIEYGPSTAYDNTGDDNLSDLPFPVTVVKSSTVSDGRGNSYTTSYDYADGAFSWQEREFRGFGYVKTIDPDGNYSESYFKQDDVFKGRLYKQEVKDSSASLYAKSENVWQSTEAFPGVDFVYLSQTDNYVYDGDATYKHTQTTFQYDEYGNPTQVFSEGEVGVSGDEKILITEYTHNTTDWLIGFAKHAYLLDESSNKVSEKWFYYDNAASIDVPPVKGLLTKEEVWLRNPLTAQEKTIATLYAYDLYGNMTSTTDPLLRTMTTQYDPTLHIYPVQTSNILGHSVSSTYDYKTGQVLTTTDPNSQTTEQVYDALGRPIKVIGPLDNIAFPGVTYEYDLSTFPIKITKHTRIQHLAPEVYTSYSFYDGLSRAIQSKSPAEDDPQTGNPRQVISGTVTFDSRGKVKEKYFPYFVDASANFIPPTYAQQKVTFDYDAVGRVIKTTNADGTFSTASYSDWVAIGTDENGHSKTSYFDAYGRIVTVEEHNELETYTTSYEYDAQGNLAKLTDDQSNITEIWYDSLGRKLKMDDPDMGIWEYEYDDPGNLKKQTDAKGQFLEFNYDAINRLTQKYSGAQTLVTYYYDEPTKQNCVGRLSKVEDQSGQTEFFYDVLGREVKSEKVINGTGPYTVERTYDALDRLMSLTYPDDEIVNYTYN